jgi:hypothetical protein
MKRKSFKNIQIENNINLSIRPFQERPSEIILGNGYVDRISAHDLFSYYTADIIKKDTIFIK